MAAFGKLNDEMNDQVARATGRGVSVTAGRTYSTHAPVVSVLTSRANGSLVRVIMRLDTGDRFDDETGTIATQLWDVLNTIPRDKLRAYQAAWLAVFHPRD